MRRRFSTLQKSVCRTHSRRMNSAFGGVWGIVPNKQKRWVCINTRIACGGLSVMIGCWIPIRHKYIKNRGPRHISTLTLWFCVDITATPLRQSRLWKSRCSCNVHLPDCYVFDTHFNMKNQSWNSTKRTILLRLSIPISVSKPSIRISRLSSIP